MQTPEWWVDVTLPMLENLRRRLRLLVAFIEKGKRIDLLPQVVDVRDDRFMFIARPD